MTVVGDYRSLGGKDPLTFAHRGGAGLWPENTLQAFIGAARLGCSHLETDLRMSRDGQIVLMHDATLERTTNAKGEVGSLTLAELKRLDAGYRFTRDGQTYPARGKGVEIPTFAEVVLALPTIRFNVEIKERGRPDLPTALSELIDRYDLADRVIVAGEQHALVDDFRRVTRGRVATSASRRECLQFWFASKVGLTKLLRPAYQALQIPVRAGRVRFLTRGLLGQAHSMKIAVHVWTIDDAPEMHRLLDFGVDGLMSDYPDRLLDVVQQRAQKSASR